MLPYKFWFHIQLYSMLFKFTDSTNLDKLY